MKKYMKCKICGYIPPPVYLAIHIDGHGRRGEIKGWNEGKCNYMKFYEEAS